MANSKSLIISEPARRDLARIGTYTQETWGKAQKRRYLTALKDALVRIRDTPALAPERVDISPGLRVHAVQKHLVFYRETADGSVLIVRVLHQTMDPGRHISETKA